MNELALVIINEGADYQARLETARITDPITRFQVWTYRVRSEAFQQREQFGSEFTVGQMAEAVAQLEDYYRTHLKEIERAEIAQQGPTGFYAEIREEHVGRPLFHAFGRAWLVSNFIGQILPGDVGKRVYLVGDTLQVENDEQRDRRKRG